MVEEGEIFFDFSANHWLRVRDASGDPVVFDVSDTDAPERSTRRVYRDALPAFWKDATDYETLLVEGNLDAPDSPVPPCPWVDSGN